jgi:glycerol-3-phosphate acyltransferase PlsY
MVATYLLVVVCSYLLGSLPSAYLVVWGVVGVDVRAHGDTSVGAKNSYRTVLAAHGSRVLALAAFVLITLLDGAKGYAAVALGMHLFEGNPTGFDWLPVVAGTAVIAGHNFPWVLRFRGGKGFASLGGVTLVHSPVPLFLFAASLLVLLAILRNFALSSMIAVGVTAILLGLPVFGVHEPQLAVTALAVLAVMVLRHLAGPARPAGAPLFSRQR